MRTQQRGNITDHLDEVDGEGRCRVTCVHGKEWRENGLKESGGGTACDECIAEWMESPERAARFG